jgi:hypothetical protein
VAGIAELNRRSEQLVETMIDARDGLVRFAWGITFDGELNHHPQPPAGLRRRFAFDPNDPRAFLRVERQTIWGFPEVGAVLFTIRTYLYDCKAVCHNRKRRGDLIAAIRSMSPESLAYKGLADSADPLCAWLATGA